MLMPKHFLGCHPFVGHSYLSRTLAGDEVGSEYHCFGAELDDLKDSGSDSEGP